MAKTTYATGASEVRKVWSEKLYRDSRKESYFERFMGTSAESLVQVKNELQAEKGDRITFTLRMRLAGAGVTSGTLLEGNEEKLSTYTYNLTLEQYRHAVRDDGAMSRKRVAFDLDKEHEDALRVWGSEKIDSLCFTALQASPTKVFYHTTAAGYTAASAATAKAALVLAESKLDLTLISIMKAWAKTGGGRTYVPIRPVMVDGEPWYILLTHPDALYDLKATSAWQQAAREAEVRGDSNPLFKGSKAVWDGVIVHEHENITTGADGGGSTVTWCGAYLMGAQALAFGWGRRPELVYEEFDYKNEHGYGFDMIMSTAKPVFNSLDYGSVAAYVARTNVSGL